MAFLREILPAAGKSQPEGLRITQMTRMGKDFIRGIRVIRRNFFSLREPPGDAGKIRAFPPPRFG
jgi:hypothetical protein